MNAPYHPDGADPDAYGAQFFKATLLPYRSLSARGFQIMILSLLLLWACIGMVFMQIRAWPVVGLFGLDIALIYLAFRLNYYAARQREEISVSREQLLIRQVSASGHIRAYQFNPFRTRFHITRKDDIGITQMQLQSDDRSLDIGRFLPPDDRESFATAFSNALIRSRR
ncbi:DUF2244 domain-containing protein [Bacillus subtilis]|uniref:DUF2244 domain-containing protein n=1 Tax=Pseudochrobactrum asaccharolyticum TaxID=354351 RepID=UPI001F3422D5|nr:DUF2244 domain-containing protein [Pseudochrobactrum asaccharolyticum]MCF7644343.1 DUF2244 domain-containing protein [Pseudochrobactrum asaccharolyticum]MCF7670418.1 DUF2244 domain-containing protein [Bacillus subtilis]